MGGAEVFDPAPADSTYQFRLVIQRAASRVLANCCTTGHRIIFQPNIDDTLLHLERGLVLCRLCSVSESCFIS